MKNRNSARHATVTAVALSLWLAGCGGGGDDAGAAPSAKAEGAYAGTLTGSASSAFQLLVLESDEYWSLYGSTSGGTFFVAGFIQGSGASNNGSFASSNGLDFGFATPVQATVSASYVVGTSIQGTVAGGGQNVTFTGVPIAPALYAYATAARLSDIQGNWNLTSLTGAPATLNVSAAGALTGSSQGCTFSGTMTPRASGKNVFNVALTFGAAPCLLPGQPASGIAISSVLAGSSVRQLIVAGVNSARTSGTTLFGTR